MEDVNLSEVIVKEAVIFEHEPFDSKETMFDFMASKFVESGIVSNKKAYIKALQERELLGSTYMGNLIGLPHGKCDEVLKPGIGFCRCKLPFTYQSCGEEGDVKYVFMLAIAGTQTGEQYMRVLATLAGLLAHDDFLEAIDTCVDYEALLEEIKKRN